MILRIALHMLKAKLECSKTLLISDRFVKKERFFDSWSALVVGLALNYLKSKNAPEKTFYVNCKQAN